MIANGTATAIGYIRVSTEEQAKSGLSLEHQAAKIRAYCDAMDITLVEIIEDAGYSAKDLRRPGVRRALAMLKRKDADTLVILKLDRLTRSVKDLGDLVETFNKTGAALMSVQDSINTATAAGRLVMNILGSVAQWEREAIGERTRAAMSVMKERQEYTGGRVPYGYQVNEAGTLEKNLIEQKAVALVLSLGEAGYSLRKIAAELEAQGYLTREGKTFSAKTISMILKREAA